ncbi:uncharacterized protein LOC128547590 [Mercenaria mercenaria]|uniref:uncharacterized protein LOC128547590 n=1 Tax=Mercenaria mercenaria TaxID=6596 RepID=UPI00234FAE36|nr:uncharacterized protein LOC128547590 [Mercenaria mercenaria]
MLSKLPEWLVIRWNRIAATSKEELKVFPSFKQFVDFVSKEAKIASDPVTSVFYVKGNLSSASDKNHPSSLHGDKLTQSDSRKTGSENGNGDVNKENTVTGTLVQAGHSGAAFLSNIGQISKCSMILPVFVSHCDNPDRDVLVYALLDTQSDTTFLLDGTRSALDLSGVDVKLSLSTLHAENKIVNSQKLRGLQVRGFYDYTRITLPDTYTREIMPANRAHIPTPEHAKFWPHLKCISDCLPPLQEAEIGLLIRYNCPQALVPREVITPVGNGPFAQKTDLGWTIVGTIDLNCVEDDSIGSSHRVLCCEVPLALSVSDSQKEVVLFSLRTKVKEVVSSDILRILDREFCDSGEMCNKLSQEDQLFVSKLSKGICFQDDHYVMPLPFKGAEPVLPNNKSMALKRVKSLRQRLKRDSTFCQHYSQFMKELISNGHAERVPELDLNSNKTTWFIPHHGVYHPQKRDKIRVVFDCSATFEGESLNAHLLQGPDLTNKLVGVLCRFRKEPVALMCDVEKMFHQFKVCKAHRDYLRFLWWEDDDFERFPTEFRMTVHLFGATSSPGCANFGMKKMASDNEEQFGSDIADFIRHDFYVDDGLRSYLLFLKLSIWLRRVLSYAVVIQSLPSEARAKDLKNVDLIGDNLPVQRTLGVLWCLDSDTVQYEMVSNNRPLTRRGILSTVSSIYDPLGFISPVALSGKQILQQMCADQVGWDDPLPESLNGKWVMWCADLKNLTLLKFPRCVKPEGFGKIRITEMHHFSNASSYGYGQCSYIRLVNDVGQVHCALLMGKSPVVPLRPITIPHLELTAAVLVQQIKEHTNPNQWNYVASGENPADLASRGASVAELAKTPMWLNGPEFLWKQDAISANTGAQFSVCPDDPELKHVQAFLSNAKPPCFSSLLERLEYFSDWHRCKRAVALVLRYKGKLLQKSGKLQTTGVEKRSLHYSPITVNELQKAETEIFKAVQLYDFKGEIDTLKTINIVRVSNDRAEQSLRTKSLKGRSNLCSLDPFLDKNGLICVGGRVQHAEMSDLVKFPVVLPRKGHITELVTRHYHDKVQHQGRGMTTNVIRNNGLWIIGCSLAVSHVILKCVVCRKLRCSFEGQKMADLPSDRLEPSPPFTYCAVDYFGPFYVKEGRKEMKRYGVMFTCLTCRAVHVETATSLETDSFINCLRRFITIRGPIRQLRSDRGTNFIGAKNESKSSLAELPVDNDQIKQFLLREGCDWFEWKMNVPAASHMGGVWERQIRSVRSVLATLLHTHGNSLDDDSLRTFLYEAASIVNSCPLTVANVNDPLSVTPLTPNHLLTMKTTIILPPPGNFQTNDMNCKHRWRRVQFLLNQFWTRWRNEYLQNLQMKPPSRKKRRRHLHARAVQQLRITRTVSEDSMPDHFDA